MTASEAKQFIQEYYEDLHPSDDVVFRMEEAFEYLFRTTGKSEYAMELGSHYYEEREFLLAEQYYTWAAEKGNLDAQEGLAYIYYYGRTGRKDYKKAFHYYSLVAKTGDIEANYKIADMYKNGYYVEKDYQKYVAIIESLYPKVKDARRLNALLPEVFSRLGTIRLEEGRKEEAANLFLEAKAFLAQRMQYTDFFGSATTMYFIITGLYQAIPFDEEDFDFYDIFIKDHTPSTIRFFYEGRRHTLQIVRENQAYPVLFDGKWFESFRSLIFKGEIDKKKLREIAPELYGFTDEH